MAFLSGPAQGVQLVVGNRLEAMLSHQPQTLQLHPFDAISQGLMVDLQRFHSLNIQRVVGHEHLAQISFHGLFPLPWYLRYGAMSHLSIRVLPALGQYSVYCLLTLQFHTKASYRLIRANQIPFASVAVCAFLDAVASAQNRLETYGISA